jgi:hypothetical protein
MTCHEAASAMTVARKLCGKLGHDWTDWNDDMPGIGYRDGLEDRECSTCGTTETRRKPRKGAK